MAGFPGMMIGGFICGIITAVIGATNAQNGAKTPPKVQADIVSPTPSKPAASANPKIKERLVVLETLREDGLISSEEYREKRKAIIDAV